VTQRTAGSMWRRRLEPALPCQRQARGKAAAASRQQHGLAGAGGTAGGQLPSRVWVSVPGALRALLAQGDGRGQVVGVNAHRVAGGVDGGVGRGVVGRVARRVGQRRKHRVRPARHAVVLCCRLRLCVRLAVSASLFITRKLLKLQQLWHGLQRLRAHALVGLLTPTHACRAHGPGNSSVGGIDACISCTCCCSELELWYTSSVRTVLTVLPPASMWHRSTSDQKIGGRFTGCQPGANAMGSNMHTNEETGVPAARRLG